MPDHGKFVKLVLLRLFLCIMLTLLIAFFQLFNLFHLANGFAQLILRLLKLLIQISNRYKQIFLALHCRFGKCRIGEMATSLMPAFSSS